MNDKPRPSPPERKPVTLLLKVEFNAPMGEDHLLQDLALAGASNDGVVVRTAHEQHFGLLKDIDRVD